jgi:hypothetical protein
VVVDAGTGETGVDSFYKHHICLRLVNDINTYPDYLDFNGVVQGIPLQRL